MGKITATEVARHAKVSLSAVSRAFTPGRSIASATAERVFQSAKELGYRPNVLARSLITGRSKIIGLVIGYFENQFYPEALEILSERLQTRGYHVLLFLASKFDEDVDKVLHEIMDYQVDGIVMASVSMSSKLSKECHNAGIPVVLFNRIQNDQSFSAVSSNNHQGGRLLADFLVGGDHKRIGLIRGWEKASTQRDREKGFREGLQAVGMDLYAIDVGNFNYNEAQAATRRMFKQSLYPDAVFVVNDHMAVAAMDVIRYEYKLRIPEDVSVVGYDDVKIASWPSYDLTTVRQPCEDMAEETVKILINIIEGESRTPRRLSLGASLVVRSSARIPKNYPL